ncbi:MAG: RNA methyltransferase [Oligoflexus sp.]|nr:RNA methyltransferase [Oligoflexus sp.]
MKKPQRRTSISPSGGLYLTSWSGLDEYLRARPDLIVSIRCPPADKKKLEQLLAKNQSSLSCSIDYSEVEKGLAVFVEVPVLDEFAFLEAAAKSEREFILACDHVTDTRNLGALARTAAYFGMRYLILPKDRQAPISGATLGTAQGAFAYVQPVMVTNLGRTLNDLKERAYWILAADMDGQPVESIRQDYEKKVLVLGAEDKGVSQGILAKADLTVAISPAEPKLESLNVSVAAGILIHALHAHSAALKK